jgi:CheY-like chemotaxis protein
MGRLRGVISFVLFIQDTIPTTLTMNVSTPAKTPTSSMAMPVSTARGLPSKDSTARARILYVDDDNFIRELGRQVLGRFGYQVDIAADGDEALAALREEDYHLLITDQSMPRRTGAQLIVQIRQEGLHLPVVITSEVWGLRPVAEARPHVAAVLPKPFAAVELLEAVQQVLDRTMSTQPAELALKSMVKRVSVPPTPHRYWGINE